MRLASLIPSRKINSAHIQHMSDLHLERIQYNFQITKEAPYLVLGGDIGRFCDFDKYSSFIQEQCKKFDQVLLVAGNHEFYGSSREEGLKAGHALEANPSSRGKLKFLNRTRIDLEGTDVIVLGCTLQSHIGADCKRLTNDFRRIKDWTTEQHDVEHEKDLKWLQLSLEDISRTAPDKRVLIVTHYAPSFKNTCHPAQESNDASPCFCSHTLEAFQTWIGADQVSYWVFGHTHWNSRFKVGSTVVTSNQLMNESFGLSALQKVFKHRSFDPRATIEI